jgi:benzoyl-CoA reductase subunit C
MIGMSLEEIERYFHDVMDDSYVTFKYVVDWKNRYGGYALGYFPVYFPVEIPHSMGILPVTLYGASGKINIDIATAHTQSFVCSICKSVFQLGIEDKLDVFDVLVFTNICDVARNLSGIFERHSEKKIIYLHYPINNWYPESISYLREEYLRLIHELEGVTGRRFDIERLRDSIRLFNEKRRLLNRLRELRIKKPWLIPYTDYYCIVRAGSLMPVEEYNKYLNRYLDAIIEKDVKPIDRVRILVKGNFCEQPPLAFMRTIEDAGCFIIDDDSMVGQYWIGEVDPDGDPVSKLAEAYVNNSVPLTVRYHPKVDKQKYLLDLVKKLEVEGVIFLTPKFCEPSLYDYIIHKLALDGAKIPYLHLEYEEYTSSYGHARTMVETFVESILFD